MLPTPSRPASITPAITALCSSISPTPPLYVAVQPESWALENECFPNVREKVKREGGAFAYGWAIWQAGRFFVEAEHHAVWQTLEGGLVDITPQRPAIPTLLFLPDDTAIYDFSRTERQDNKRLALFKDRRLDRILELYSVRTGLFNSVPVVEGKVTLRGAAAMRYHEIEEEIVQLSAALTFERSLNIWRV